MQIMQKKNQKTFSASNLGEDKYDQAQIQRNTAS